MSVRHVDASRETGIACMLLDTLTAALDAQVLGVIASDTNGVFVMPLPSEGLNLFRYLASVNWANTLREAEEHLPTD